MTTEANFLPRRPIVAMIVATAAAASLGALAAAMAVGSWRQQLWMTPSTSTPQSVPHSVPSSLVVEMKGREYYWQFRFPGADGRFDTADDLEAGKILHVPAQCDVELLVRSDDYVYTFAVDDLKFRQTAIPQQTRRAKLPTEVSGAFDINADPLCSVRLFHEEVMGKIVVESPAEFGAWWDAIQKQSTL